MYTFFQKFAVLPRMNSIVEITKLLFSKVSANGIQIFFFCSNFISLDFLDFYSS